MIGSFLAGPYGSAFRVFCGLLLGSLVTYLGSGQDIRGISLDEVWGWVGVAAAVALPIVIAAINPADTRFGAGSVKSSST
jgi:hypothetical protein